MHTIIIDEDGNSNGAKLLKSLCVEHIPYLKEVHTYSSIAEAETRLLENKLDLVFLISNSKFQDHLQVINHFKSKECALIAVLSNEENALTAFKQNVDACLLMPIDSNALISTVNEVRSRFGLEKEQEKIQHFKDLIDHGPLNKIALATLEGYTFVFFDDIVRCEAQGNYTNVYFFDGSFLMLTKTLKHYDSILTEKGFVRLHKTHLVNTKYIRTFTKGKENYVELSNGTKIEVSTRKKDHLLQKLKS